MTLVSSGQLCLGSSGGISDDRSVQAELGAAGNLCLSTALSDAGISGNCLSDFYGYSSIQGPTADAVINGFMSAKEVTVSQFGISDGGTFTIPDNFWIWSDNVNVAALTVDVNNVTIINNGNIIGKGGLGGSGFANSRGTGGQDGGSAINVTATGVTVENNSGAYIAGGGGGGWGSGGGGGAGGGDGWSGTPSGYHSSVTISNVGGSLGQRGDTIASSGNPPSNGIRFGQHAGDYSDTNGWAGGTGFQIWTGNNSGSSGVYGGAGGRVLPGQAGPQAAGRGRINGNAGRGGGPSSSGGHAQTGSGAGNDATIHGGGGGWGANGGDQSSPYTGGTQGKYDGNGAGRGGAGGAAISGNVVTLSNNGTIYGTDTAIVPVTVSSSQQQATTSGLGAVSGGELIISSGVYLWSDNTSIAGLTVDTPNLTIINNGFIIGRGGNGGSGNGGSGGAGGPAINVTASGVSILNNSGAYIAGGGGGGGAQGDPTDSDHVPGGGGAGGGATGTGYNTNSPYAGGAIGQPGNGGGGFGGGTPASPGDHQGYGGQITGQDGGAGAFSRPTSGGRNPAGTNSGNAASGGDVRGGAGGFWGEAGQAGIGWTGEKGAGGTGGAAITGEVPTLTDNGTIYGSVAGQVVEECSMNTDVTDTFSATASYWGDNPVSTGFSPNTFLTINWNGVTVYNDNNGGGQGTTTVVGSDGATYTRQNFFVSFLGADYYNVCRTG